MSGISPSSGSPAGGTTVTISGSGLTGATSVTFGPAIASIVSIGSDTSITVTTPGGSGTVAVTVTTPAGSSAAGPTFAYAAPLVAAISPNNGDTLGGATTTITGANFTGATSVSFGAKPATRFSVVSDTTITAVSPTGTDGSVDITVTTPSGTSAAGPADRFLYH